MSLASAKVRAEATASRKFSESVAQCQSLTADRRFREVDRDFHIERGHRRAHRGIVRAELGESLAVGDPNRAENLDHPARSVQGDDPRTLQQKGEWRGRPVHDRHFRTVDLDQHVIDSGACQGGHQMLDRADAGREPPRR